ncbi:hypothetical protein ACFQ51_39250 [Streptomyces kaempferi]
MSNTDESKTQGLSYYPWWLDKLADNVTGNGSFIDNGPIPGPEAVRSVVTAARGLYEFQDFTYTGDYGNNGFIEEYTTRVKGETLHVVVTVARNAARRVRAACREPPASQRHAALFPRDAQEVRWHPLVDHFLADES